MADTGPRTAPSRDTCATPPVEIDWPDVTTLDRSALSELRKLSNRVPQAGKALEATLDLDRETASGPAG